MQRNRKTRRSTQKGSSYIFEGAYGCAFGNPPLKCKGDLTRRSSKYISKVMTHANAAQEIEYGKKFQRIDPQRKYFLWPEESCLLDTSYVQETNQPSHCRGLNVRNASKGYHLLLSENGGVNLGQFVPKSDEWANFLMSLLNLFEGLAVAHSNNIAHFDIKPYNIVTLKQSDGSFKTRFIDFGISSYIDRINPTTQGLIANNYLWWPFEARFYNPAYKHIWAVSDKEKIIKEWYALMLHNKRHLPLHSYWTETGDRFKAKGFDVVIERLNLQDTRKAMAKLDIFSLGVTLSEVYFNLTKHSQKWSNKDNGSYMTTSLTVGFGSTGYSCDEKMQWHNEVQKRISGPIGALVYAMTHISPDRRPTAAEAKVAYSNIIPDIKKLFTNENIAKYFSDAVCNYTTKYQAVPPPPPGPPPAYAKRAKGQNLINALAKAVPPSPPHSPPRSQKASANQQKLINAIVQGIQVKGKTNDPIETPPVKKPHPYYYERQRDAYPYQM